MTLLRSDIDRYIQLGQWAQICVYRKKLDVLDTIIMSIYIVNSDEQGYAIEVVFDPVEMINYGEGWIWKTSGLELDDIIKTLETYSGKPFEQWTNYSKTGEYEDLTLDLEPKEKSRQNDEFIYRYKGGEPLLPVLPEGAYWKNRPYP